MYKILVNSFFKFNGIFFGYEYQQSTNECKVSQMHSFSGVFGACCGYMFLNVDAF